MAYHNDPFPGRGFDLNLSHVSGGFLCEEGSEKGKTIIAENQNLFESETDSRVAEKEAVRKKVTDSVLENIARYTIPDSSSFGGIVERNYESEMWKDESRTCVECGACNTICPTCHCFLLHDRLSDNAAERLRSWDSCMFKTYAEVAGGANPRPALWQRLRNRFEKKFDYFPRVFDLYACTGCGRCISACPAKIDIRRVLARLTQNV
jgi:sulfhydrogenase subunit beta (sulfur reductase)